MKLYLKQRVFSLTDKYDIYDYNGKPYFHVCSEFLSLTAKMHLCDLAGNELFLIRRHFTFLLAKYEIFCGERLYAEIQQQMSWLKPRLAVKSVYGDFEIQGDFWNMHYTLFCNGSAIGAVDKKWLSWGDSYELDISDQMDPGFFCALVIAIDNCVHNEDKS